MCKKKGIYNIEDVKIPLAIPSVDMSNGKVYCFTSCQKRKEFSDYTYFINDISIGKAVRASCSYPVVFSPCNYEKKKLIDGGIRQNVPWKELKELGADKVISLVFESEVNEKCCDNLIEVAGSSIDLLCRELSNYELEGADLVIKMKTEKVGLLDMGKIDELYKLGYNTMKEKCHNLKKVEKTIF